jgi:1-acyl-sn-glycerol-3-phosphate acyltransferase
MLETSHLAPIRPLPWLAPEGAVRSSVRLTRIGMFTAETLARLLLDGAGSSLEQRARELSWVAENMLALTGARPRIQGDVPAGPCVIVSNHISYLDPVAIASHVRCAPIAKSEVMHWPAMGEIARRTGVLFVKRGCSHSGARVLREGLRALAQGVSILVFPEGTTTPGDGLLPFQRGAFGMAKLAGVPVVPVAVHYESRDAAWIGNDGFLPHLARTVARPTTRMSAHFLPPLDPERASVDELCAEAHAQIEAQLASAMPDDGLHVYPLTRAVA